MREAALCFWPRQGSPAILTAEFAAAADPSVSFDGKRILFSGKRTTQDKWDIWEMDLDGRNKKQITRDFGNCREPEYLARSSITPPDFDDKVRWIAFVSDAAGAYEEGKPDLATSLYAASLEPVQGRGSVTRRSTFNLSSDFSPTVLQDGRVLFTSRQKYAEQPGKVSAAGCQLGWHRPEPLLRCRSRRIFQDDGL